MSAKAKPLPGAVIVTKGGVAVVHSITFGPGEIIDSAVALRELGQSGTPLSKDSAGLAGREVSAVMGVLESHALLALRLLEMIHGGHHAELRKLADGLREFEKGKVPPMSPVIASIMRAARKSGGKPTREAVQDELKRFGAGIGGERSDKLEAKLAAIGIELPHRKRGDTLKARRKKLPPK